MAGNFGAFVTSRIKSKRSPGMGASLGDTFSARPKKPTMVSGVKGYSKGGVVKGKKKSKKC
jgi:hypothetical protein